MVDFLKLENRIRATPLDFLKQGLERSQWECVQIAYYMLTGINLPLPKGTANATSELDTEPEREQGSIVPIQQPDTPSKVEDNIPDDDAEDLETDEDEFEDEEEDDEGDADDEDGDETDEKRERGSNTGPIKPLPKPKSKIRTRTRKIRATGKNFFVDDGLLAPEDKIFQPKPEVIESHKRLQMQRGEYRKIKVKCRKCGLIERVDPMLGPRKLDANYKTKYVCNECSCGG